MEDLNKLNMRTRGMNQADLEAARADPINEIYEYEDKPLEPWQKIDADTARRMAHEIREAYVALRRQDTTLTDAKIRERLANIDTRWRSFAEHSHTTIWLALTDRTTSSDKITNIFYLAAVRVKVDNGEVSEADAQMHVQEYFLDKCN